MFIIKSNMGQKDRQKTIGVVVGIFVATTVIAIHQGWYFDYYFGIVSIMMILGLLTYAPKYVFLYAYASLVGNKKLEKMVIKTANDCFKGWITE